MSFLFEELPSTFFVCDLALDKLLIFFFFLRMFRFHTFLKNVFTV